MPFVRRKFRLRILVPIGIAMLLGVISGAARSDDSDFTVVPKIAYEYKTVSFSIADKTFKPLYQSVDLGITAAYKSLYFSANYDSSVKDALIHNTTRSGGGGLDDSVLNMSRVDWAATLGYNVGKGFTVFGGYKSGTTNVLNSSNYGAIGATEPLNQTFEFTLRGPFLGAGYSLRFPKGTLDVSVAYAYLSPDLISYRVQPSVEYTRVPGEASGFSYGLIWSGPLSESAGYSVGLKSNQYRFRADPSAGGGSSDDEASFDEDHYIFFVSASKYF